MARVKALSFPQHLEKEGLGHLYALVGEDAALVSICLADLKAVVESPDMPGGMAKDLDSPEEAQEVFDELHTQPFMGMQGRRMVVVRDGAEFMRKHADAIQKWAENPSENGVLVLCTEKLDMRRTASKAIASGGTVVDCSKIRWRDARTWIGNETRKAGKALTSDALSALLEAVGPDLSALSTELEKLFLHAGDENTVTVEDVEELVPESRARSIFELSDAIANAEVDRAIHLGEHLLLHGEDPVGIVSFLSYRMRALWQVKRLAQNNASSRDISREVGMPDFAVRKSLRAVRKVTEEWFARKTRLLADADMELKSSSLPAGAKGVWLTSFLARMCL